VVAIQGMQRGFDEYLDPEARAVLAR